MPDKFKPPYEFSTHIGASCAQQMRTFPDLAEKLKMDAAMQRQGPAVQGPGHRV
jgi:hypothetical protein